MQLNELDNLIRDGRDRCCQFVLEEVVAHLERRSFLLHEIVAGMSRLLHEQGYEKAAFLVEESANLIQDSKKGTNDDLDSII